MTARFRCAISLSAESGPPFRHRSSEQARMHARKHAARAVGGRCVASWPSCPLGPKESEESDEEWGRGHLWTPGRPQRAPGSVFLGGSGQGRPNFAEKSRRHDYDYAKLFRLIQHTCTASRSDMEMGGSKNRPGRCSGRRDPPGTKTAGAKRSGAARLISAGAPISWPVRRWQTNVDGLS